MFVLRRTELRRFNRNPVAGIRQANDIDYVGDGTASHRLDVISPIGGDGEAPLPVYVYFHGGGWTSGDKSTLTEYCSSQAARGMVVVNVNYRHATRFHMSHMLEDADSVLLWVRNNVASHGGDPRRIVLGGDSAGGQIAALFSAATRNAELGEHHGLPSADGTPAIRGLVLHCSALDFSVMFEKGFVLGMNFVRILLPKRTGRPVRGEVLRGASHFLSPIEWIGSDHPPVLVTTSERDYFYRANVRFIHRLRQFLVPVDTLIYARSSANTHHTWQQDSRYPESQEVYRRLAAFVHRVTAPIAQQGADRVTAALA
jgi:acetyl esterase